MFAGYCGLRASFVPESGLLVRAPGVLAGRLVLGLMEVFLFSWLPACFTGNALLLVGGLIFGASAFMGFAVAWRRQRTAAIALLAIFVAFGLGTALHPVPRNLAVPGLVMGAFACLGGARLLELEREGGRKELELLLFAASLCALASLSQFSSYALQDWIEPINARLESEGYTGGRGLVHPIDMNTPLPGLAPSPPASADPGRLRGRNPAR